MPQKPSYIASIDEVTVYMLLITAALGYICYICTLISQLLILVVTYVLAKSQEQPLIKSKLSFQSEQTKSLARYKLTF